MTPLWITQPVRARQAMVTTADEHATRAGVEVLREGGSVADAAVAIAFALGVTQPGMCGIGGGGHALHRTAEGMAYFLDFRERAPLSATRDMFCGDRSSVHGWTAAATPGAVRGLWDLHQSHGRMPWARLLEPAIRLARDGHAVSWQRSMAARDAVSLQFDPECALRKQAGEPLVQPELAATHERIAAGGVDEFYRGETARRLAAEMASHGGAVTLSDLAAYRCAVRAPITARYRHYDIITAPPPSGGGFSLVRMLAVLEPHDLPMLGHNSSAYLDLLARTMRDAVEERVRIVGDPEFAHTTHFNVVHASGEAIALTFTLNGIYGCGVTAPGLGFLLNNNMDNFATRPGQPNQYGLVQYEVNAIEPGKRPVSSMTPTMALRDGQLALVTGTPGGPTIPTAVLQIVLNALDFGMNASDALLMPRVHHQWRPDVLYHEAGFSQDTLHLLAECGHVLQPRLANNDASMVRIEGGWLEGAVDPRREGRAEGI
ncbi:MAG TPA: gamma-glutamyltransferase family protein [Bryobacteraceae bacterium]|nr:gamma-glutamyltransferase family protein [Bryobacteraceae bacterium]